MAAGSLDARSREEMTSQISGNDAEISLHIVLWRSLGMVLETIWANEFMSELDKGSRASSGCQDSTMYKNTMVYPYSAKDWRRQNPDIFPIKLG